MFISATAPDERKPLLFYRELFPTMGGRVYFNHAAFGRLATPVVAALTEHLAQHSRYGQDAGRIWEEQVRRTRAKAAAFVGADPAEIAFTKNTPDALNIVANGLRWQRGDRVVICDLEFPANVFPWLNLVEKGVETIFVRSESGRVPIEAVIEAIDDRTRLVSLSWVEFSNGYRNDLRIVGQVCHERGALLAVDAIQGLGALRFDVRELNVDFFGAASHKWLLGPVGVGWFFCRRELIEQLNVSSVGHSSYERGPTTSWLDYNLRLWPDARRFEPGIANWLGLAGLEAALDLLIEVGIDRIEAQVKHLTDMLVAGLLDRGLWLAAPRDGEQWSGIVTFSSERRPSDELFQPLQRAGFSVTHREGAIRVAPHFYNNEEDIERFLATLP